MTQSIELTEIVRDEKGWKNKVNKGFEIIDINKYIVELIRISKMYKFQLRIKPKIPVRKKESEKENTKIRNSIEEHISKTKIIEESFVETRTYRIIREEFIDEIKVSYNIEPKQKEVEYKVEKPKIRYQELWEKEGFYQETTTQVRVRVQLWPEHLPYDHFKRKRAFLFC